ncbi:glycopeptide [Mucidula mucida]|nr:glycopeptide [Mucidula mucida]KAF8889965.1 glycopeptide [Mucidula mucida]
MFKLSSLLTLTVASVIALVAGESHTIHFDNRCGFGTPTLISQSGAVLSTGGDYTSNGAIIGAIAYLQTGNCGFNGDRCTLVETTLKNPTSPGAGSSTDISLIAPHTFSVTSGFGYYNGCDGAGADCNNVNCATAFHTPTDTWVQVACQTNDVDLAITFCL